MPGLETGSGSESICIYLSTKELKVNICGSFRGIPPTMPLLARDQGPVDERPWLYNWAEDNSPSMPVVVVLI